jgi:hypothetical protein
MLERSRVLQIEMVYAVLGCIYPVVLVLVSREGLAPSIGPNWIGNTWRRRQNPVSEMLCVLNKNRTMVNVQKQNNWVMVTLAGKMTRWYVSRARRKWWWRRDSYNTKRSSEWSHLMCFYRKNIAICRKMLQVYKVSHMYEAAQRFMHLVQ